MLYSRSTSARICEKEVFVVLWIAAAWGFLACDKRPVEYGSYTSGIIDVCVVFMAFKWIDLDTILFHLFAPVAAGRAFVH